MTAMLEVRDLKVAYGKILAVKKISFSVEQGQIVTLIGTNGAGKTTTLRTISGLIRPASGEILFQGKRIDASRLTRSSRWAWHTHPRDGRSSPR